MWRVLGHPRTIPQAVALLKSTIPANTLDLIRGAQPFDPAECHFGLGMWVRGELGLWNDKSRLLRACGTTCADVASAIILLALWEDLVRTADAVELARSREVRRAYDAERARERQARMDEVAEKDARITTARCPFCGKPCPTYRVTCKHCQAQVRERAAGPTRG